MVPLKALFEAKSVLEVSIIKRVSDMKALTERRFYFFNPFF